MLLDVKGHQGKGSKSSPTSQQCCDGLGHMMFLAPPLETHYQAGSEIGIDTTSPNNAYEHAERPSSKEQQQQEKPNNHGSTLYSSRNIG